MSGKLRIDRVREGKDAPRIYERNRQTLAKDQAKLRDLKASPEQARPTDQNGTTEGKTEVEPEA